MTELIEIDADGDVVLVCGEGDQQKRLRVHSALMTRASSVFKAMLSPRFREGTQLSSSGAVEIACPEDDAEAMATICYIVDHRASKASRARVCSELLQVARLSDKYDLNEVMRPHAQGWLTEKLKLINAAPSTGDRLDVGKAQTEIDERREWLLAAAYYFDLQTTFEELGREIVCKGVGVSPSSTILFGLAPAIDEDLLHVSVMLESARRCIRETLAADIEGFLKRGHGMERTRGMHSCRPSCSYVANWLWHMLEQLRHRELWPVGGLSMLSVGSSLERMGELASPDASVEKCRARKGGNGSICIGDMAPRGDWVETEFAGMIRSSRLLIPNICYTCAREGRPFNVRTCTHGKKGGSEGREDEEAG